LYNIYSDISVTDTRGGYCFVIVNKKKGSLVHKTGPLSKNHAGHLGEIFAHMKALSELESGASAHVFSDIHDIGHIIEKLLRSTSNKFNQRKIRDGLKAQLERLGRINFEYVPKGRRHGLYQACHCLARCRARADGGKRDMYRTKEIGMELIDVARRSLNAHCVPDDHGLKNS